MGEKPSKDRKRIAELEAQVAILGGPEPTTATGRAIKAQTLRNAVSAYAHQKIAALEAERDEARRERDEAVALLRKARSTIGAAGWYVSTQLAKESSVLNDSISDFLLRRAQQRYRASLRRQAQGGE